MKFLRPILAAIAVFAATFLVLTWWLHLQSVAAAVAAGFSAIGTAAAAAGTKKKAESIDKICNICDQPLPSTKHFNGCNGCKELQKDQSKQISVLHKENLELQKQMFQIQQDLVMRFPFT